MRPLLPLFVALLSAGCVLRIPALGLGGSPATSSASSTSAAPASAPGGGETSGRSPATREWARVIDRHRYALDELHARLEDQPKPGSPSSGQEQHARWTFDALKKSDALEEVARGCAAGTYRGETLFADAPPTEAHLKAEFICPKVVDRVNLLRNTARTWGVAIIDARFSELERLTTRIETEGKVPVSLLMEVLSVQDLEAQTAVFAKEVFAELGEAPPAQALARAEAVLARRKQVIAKLAADHQPDRWAKSEPAAEKAVRDVYSRRFDVKAVRMRDADWTLVRGQFGVVVRRFKGASLLVKAKDGSFCALVPAVVGQAANQTGGFGGAWGVDEFTEGFPVKCP